MIKLKKQDSLTKIIKKIENSRSREIFLDVPVWHPILSDYSSLNILKKKFNDKKLIFITKDITAKKLLTKLWFSFTIIKDEEYLKKTLGEEINLLKQNTSFFEYLVFEAKKNFNDFKKKIHEKKPNTTSKSFPFILLGLTLALSMMLLLWVFYVAVHKTTIYFTPDIEIVKVQKNFSFNNSDEISLDDNTIKLKRIQLPVTIEASFSSTNIEYDSSKQAIWEAILFNEMKTEQTLVENTRLLSGDWIIYRLKNKISIPSSNVSATGAITLWSAIVSIEADPFDENGSYVGSRGNTNEGLFTIPWLTWEFQNKIYAKSWKLTGWSDSYNVIVWEDDIEKWSWLLEVKLQNKAIDALTASLKEQNELESQNYELLMVWDSISYSDFSFINSNNTQVWDQKRNFQLSWSLTITAYAYNKDFILSRLKGLMNNRVVDENQKVIYADESSLRVAHVISNANQDERINVKATMEIEALVNRSFDDYNIYTQILKSKIAGLDTKQAYNILLNANNINNVSIKQSPFFMNKVSSKIENIFFKRKEE